MLCCYVNSTNDIQIARICNVPQWQFERKVFPGQHLLFRAPVQACLEVCTGLLPGAIASMMIPCDRLAVQALESRQS